MTSGCRSVAGSSVAISSGLYPRGNLCALPETRMGYKEAQVVAKAWWPGAFITFLLVVIRARIALT